MPESSTPLSYQTTMPEYPDVSYQSYTHQYGLDVGPQGTNNGWNRAGQALAAWTRGLPDYKTWRQNQLDEYNTRLSAYNTWLQTGEGQRKSLESGGYNASYFGGQSASASPLNYQDVAPESGLTQMAEGVQGLFSFVNALQGMRMLSEQLTGQSLKNEQQRIINKQLEENLRWKNTILFNQGNLLGYKSDSQAFSNTIRFAPVFKTAAQSAAELSKVPSDDFMFSPFAGGKSYNFKDADKAFEYQSAFENIEFLKAGTALRKIQHDIGEFNKKERQFYVESIQSIYKDFLSQQLELVKGNVSFQPTEQKLRKKAIEWGIGLNAANTAISAAKTVVSMIMPSGRVGSIAGVPNWQQNPTNTPWLSDMYGGDYLPGM